MLDDEVRETSLGYFRWVRVVWMPEDVDWSELPHQRNIVGFEPPTIGGGTAYSLANLRKFQEAWNSLEVFQKHVFQALIGAKPPNVEINDIDNLSSAMSKANYCFSVETAPRVNSIHAQINVLSLEGSPIDHASITAVANNSTTKNTVTSSEGKAVIEILAGRLYRLLVAHPKYPGALIESWDPSNDLKVTLFESENTGSMICHSTCHIPGLQGRLNPILDASNRTYLYADNIAVNGGVQQPGKFIVNEPFELEDCNGMVMQVKILFIQGKTSLLQYIHPSLNGT